MFLFLMYVTTYLIVFHAVRSNKYNVRGCILVFIILCAFFSPLKANFYVGNTTNISVIWYSAALVCQTFLAIEFGFKFSLRNAIVTIKWLLFIYFMIVFMAQLPDLSPLNSDVYAVVKLLSHDTIRGIFSSCMAFVFASGVTSVIAANTPKIGRFITFVLCISIGQTVSSFTFYTITFVNDPNIWKILVTGNILKVLMSMTYYPMIYFFKHDDRLNSEV